MQQSVSVVSSWETGRHPWQVTLRWQEETRVPENPRGNGEKIETPLGKAPEPAPELNYAKNIVTLSALLEM